MTYKRKNREFNARLCQRRDPTSIHIPDDAKPTAEQPKQRTRAKRLIYLQAIALMVRAMLASRYRQEVIIHARKNLDFYAFYQRGYETCRSLFAANIPTLNPSAIALDAGKKRAVARVQTT